MMPSSSSLPYLCSAYHFHVYTVVITQPTRFKISEILFQTLPIMFTNQTLNEVLLLFALVNDALFKCLETISEILTFYRGKIMNFGEKSLMRINGIFFEAES